MRVRETARRELDHALRALDENENPPVRVLLTLYRQCPFAFIAFDTACKATVSLRIVRAYSDDMTEARKQAVKRLAPVMLEVLLDSKGIEVDG